MTRLEKVAQTVAAMYDTLDFGGWGWLENECWMAMLNLLYVVFTAENTSEQRMEDALLQTGMDPEGVNRLMTDLAGRLGF